jgi:hypothetical protein
MPAKSLYTGTCMRSGWKLTGQTAWFKSAYAEAEVQTGLAGNFSNPEIKASFRAHNSALVTERSPMIHRTRRGLGDGIIDSMDDESMKAPNGNDQRARSTRRFKTAVKTALCVPHYLTLRSKRVEGHWRGEVMVFLHQELLSLPHGLRVSLVDTGRHEQQGLSGGPVIVGRGNAPKIAGYHSEPAQIIRPMRKLLIIPSTPSI